MKHSIAIAIAALVLASASASADVVTFSEPDFDWLATGGSATPNHIWTTGDFWKQNFLGTSVPSATDLTLDLNVDDTAFENLNLNVFVNATNVGSFTLTPPDSGFQQFNFSFPAIAGPNYNIEMIASSTISGGKGSYSMLVGPSTGAAPSFATITPEPGCLSLLVLGGIAVLRRRRR